MKQHFVKSILAAATLGLALGPVAARQAPPPAAAPQTPPSSDPFFQPPPKPKETKKPIETGPVEIPPPPLTDRINRYEADRKLGKKADPLSKYLVSEVRVRGIFELNGTLGAFVEIAGLAKPETYFVERGAKLFNGEIVAITAGPNLDNAKVVFNENITLKVKNTQKVDTRKVEKGIETGTTKP